MVRDSKGRFPKGTTGNPNGRPKRAVEDDLFQQFKRGISVGDIDVIRAALIKRASRGDVSAAKLIFEYLFGAPRQQMDMTIYSPEQWMATLGLDQTNAAT